MSDQNWERDVLRDVALEGIRERRRTRRWGILFKGLFFGYLVVVLAVALGWQPGATDTTAGPHAARIDIDGPIVAGGDNDAEKINRALRRAFEEDAVEGVVLRINSPGGSPVESNRVNEEVRRLKEEHPETPLYVVAGDVLASGAYYLSVSADAIYVDPSTMVGSIGVLMNGFGFHEAMDKLGIERRLHTAGENKAFMDPFSPEDPADVERLRELLDTIHQQFIDAVETGRGERLSTEEDLYTGDVWAGRRSIELGLADELGDLQHVTRDVIGVEDIRDYTVRPHFLDRLGRGFGAAVGDAVVERLTGPTPLK